MTNYLILLPPSEGKQSGGDLQEKLSFRELHKAREEVHKALLDAINNKEDLEKVFELKGKNLEEAVAITKKPTKALRAIKRYQGVMFKAIDYDTLSEQQKNNFDNTVIFIDGRFGLVKPQDQILDYKTKITTKTKTLNITKHWKEHLEKPLQEITKNKLIIDLLPQAHKKVLPELPLITITFAKIKNNKLTNEGHHSKKLKGALIQYITKKETITREDLEQYMSEQGHKYSKEHSNNQEIVYLVT